ncbi:MAG: hypothetical protein IK133_06015 [Clostridia bacterium]|nr:hypothetical protein [Clostridia bacterium]
MIKIIQRLFILLFLLSFFAFCVSEEAIDSVPEEEALYATVTETNPESIEYDDVLAESYPQTEQSLGTAGEISIVIAAEQETDISASADALDGLGDTSAQTEEDNISVSPAQEHTDAVSDPVVFSAKITIEVYPAGDILENMVFSFRARVNDANMEYTLCWEEHDTTKDKPGAAPSWKKIGKESVIRLTADLSMNTVEYRLIVTGMDDTEIIVPVKPFDIIPAPEPEEIFEDQNDDQEPDPADDIVKDSETPLVPVEKEIADECAEDPETEEEPIEGEPEKSSELQVGEVTEESSQEQTDETLEDSGEAKLNEIADEPQLEEATEELLEAFGEEETAEAQASETVDEIDEESAEKEPDTEAAEDLGEPLEKTPEDLIPDVSETDTDINDEPSQIAEYTLTEEPADETEPETETETEPETEPEAEPKAELEAEPGDDPENEPEEETKTEPEDQIEEQAAKKKTVAEEPVRKVIVRSSAGDCIMSGATIVLTVELEGFEENEDVTVIWEVNKGEGWETVGIGETYEYTASLESLMWDIRAKVQYQAVPEDDCGQ